MMGAAVVTSAVSTALVQYCANPYVTRITIPSFSSPSTSTAPPQLLTFETLTFLANPHKTTIPLSTLLPASDRHFANWRVKLTLSQAEQSALVDMPGFGRFKRRRFYVHLNLDEPFTPEMDKAVEVVKAAGWSGDAAPQPQVESTSQEAAGPTAVQKDWDAVVREMREGKKSE
ncbi:hypothetical protein HK097_006231 [Rhizophlyctis rosea]|uniref:Uncharacterized protein n=1 Tax=Rhizophlyctis rosea TaxID=64517 RepID=A0AAD5X2W3_9FUNG|nr:hypothetical protein HK097_006231 [Rhizophlyctis rosea]